MTNHSQHGGARQGNEGKGPVYARALLAELRQEFADVREVASALELDLREVDADGFEGALIRAKGYPLGAVMIRESIREAGRKNFTIAHEIGHFVLPDHDRAEYVCTLSDIGNWGDLSRQLEREADEFAAELLMPAPFVREIGKDAPPSLQLIEEIARKSHSSLSAAAWRYCDLSTERCAVVWSRERAIRWSKRTAHFGFSLRKGTALQVRSFAAACFDGAKVPKRPCVVPASWWISSADLANRAEIWEQSKALPAYQSVISLLWMKEGDGAEAPSVTAKKKEATPSKK
jgi:hypothetical protein